MERPSWVPVGVDIDRPSVARVYDYYLGGSHNFAADRAFAERVMAAVPVMRWIVQENRGFLRRAVRLLAEQGIDQFLDLGSGIPTVGNVHEVAQAVNPAARVVYVDHDPVAVAHSRAILEDDKVATIVAADLARPAEVLAHGEVARLLDSTRPVGVLLVSVLHFVPDLDGARAIVAGFAGGVPAGSYVAITHASADSMREEAEQAESMYNRSVADMKFRTHDEVVSLFGDLSLVEPGVVQVPFWHPETPDDVGPQATRYPGYGGVGRVG